jgi:hypothetical protein
MVASVPRGRARAVRLASAALIVAASLAMLSAAPARAATITLDDCFHSGVDALLLWNAILTANNESTNPGSDTIRLAPNCVYNFAAAFTGTRYALPAITSSVEIVGRGATLDAAGPPPPDNFGLFDVRAGGGLIVVDAQLRVRVGISTGSYFANAGDVLLKDTTIDGNFDTIAGPAIVNGSGAHFTLLDSEVTRVLHGDAANRGAAIHNQGDLYVIGSDLSDNNAFCVPQALPPIANGSISNNGHLELIDSYLRVTRTCTGSPDPLWAAGIYNQGELIIRGSAIQGHRHTRSGAALYNSGTGSVHVEATTFSSNRAGGAVYNDGDADFLNTVFVSNAASGGGGGLKNAGSAQVSYSTLTTNGGDVANIAGSLTLTAIIVQACSGTISDGGSNLKASPTSGCPGSVGDAKLQLWPFVGVKGSALALGPGSAAIDAATVSCPATDQRGLARPGGGACDIGAYENHPPAVPTNLVLSAGSNPGNSEHIGLAWANATDPDFDSLTYRLFGKDSDDAGEILLYSGSPSTAALTLAEGTYGFRVDAFDGNHASASSATLNGIVVDLTAPSSPTATPDRDPDFTATDGTEWYGDHVDVTFGASSDPLLADGSAGSGVSFVTPVQTLDTSGGHTVSGSATDFAGNVSAATDATFHVDADPPSVSFIACPGSVVLGSAISLGWTASDADSGLSSPGSGALAVDTSTIGTRALTASATDNVGHTATASCSLDVIYDFAGFLDPIVNPPGYNGTWGAGAVVPLAFSLAGNQGLAVIAAGYPQSLMVDCSTSPESTTGQPAAGSLTFSTGKGGRYLYRWTTEKGWKGTCRQLIVRLVDGTYHRANFDFR